MVWHSLKNHTIYDLYVINIIETDLAICAPCVVFIHKCSARINKNRKPFCEINEKKNYRGIKFANESLFHDHRRARTFEFTVHFV